MTPCPHGCLDPCTPGCVALREEIELLREAMNDLYVLLPPERVLLVRASTRRVVEGKP